MTPRFVARQLSHPRGCWGRITGRLMNRRNAVMNAYAMELLAIKRSDRVLEVGFGGGVNLPLLIEEASFVTGVDASPDVVNQARTKYRDAMKEGRAAFHVGRAEALPLRGMQYHKACTVNTVYFWKSLDAGCSELYRVLMPGGRLAVGFLPKAYMDRMKLPRDIFTSRTAGEMIQALELAGFKDVRVCRPRPSTAWNVLVAHR